MPWSIDTNEPSILEEQLKEKGVQAASMELDLTQQDAAEILIQNVMEKLGHT